jgi:hypothetical protein
MRPVRRAVAAATLLLVLLVCLLFVACWRVSLRLSTYHLVEEERGIEAVSVLAGIDEMRMGQSYWTRIAALVATLLAVMTPSISALPMQMSIMHREKECLYEYAEAE